MLGEHEIAQPAEKLPALERKALARPSQAIHKGPTNAGEER